ncbi:hypothetical protein BFW87_24645 [Pseudomonas fluorescens]|uniref:Uncharacterized protein n=1 Tax=Pseudomonas fluorescens TaxID=294 RepID=A0A1T2Y335_PSEFL|nr:hypothetical protein [Pseudomonas fluorescens]OPA86448.1 hypothetical protein BFW87_24645 [Pseudomonas fluorescens]
MKGSGFVFDPIIKKRTDWIFEIFFSFVDRAEKIVGVRIDHRSRGVPRLDVENKYVAFFLGAKK